MSGAGCSVAEFVTVCCNQKNCIELIFEVTVGNQVHRRMSDPTCLSVGEMEKNTRQEVSLLVCHRTFERKGFLVGCSLQ